jgi:malate dehydrogenase (quinone)
VNFGNLTRSMIGHLIESGVVSLFTSHEVKDLSKHNQWWNVSVFDCISSTSVEVATKFVFIWAWGWAFDLLQQSQISERRWLWGFPVSWQWLVCINPDIIAQHEAKVYGKATLWAPPMSVPHLDTRIIDDTKSLLFGPFAWFTTKFLKQWSWLDLPLSLARHNIRSMIGAWIHNIPLTRYLIGQVLQSPQDRITALREYMPSADMKDRELREAWYRVQIIKPDLQQGGVLQFGTEVIISWDRTLATLLWASPGASTSVDIMLKIIEQCWPQYIDTIHTLIPSYGQDLANDPELLQKARTRSQQLLKL